MTHVLTLISHPAAKRVDENVLQLVQGQLTSEVKPAWLSENIAADFSIQNPLSEGTFAQLQEKLAALEVDVVQQPVGDRRKKLLIADMDSTMIEQECIDELAAEIGIKDQVADITAKAMRGEIEFEPALRERVALLKGLDEEIADKVIADRIVLRSGGKELVRTMRENGAFTALVSGGFTAFTSRIGDEIGFDTNRANVLLTEGGKLTGKVAEPILGQQAKVDALCEFVAKRGISLSETIAVGDGANDLGMIGIAGAGVALHAKPAVAAKASMKVDFGDLTALLFIQGYKASEFVAA